MKNYVFWAIFLAFALISCTSNEFYEVNISQNANLCKKTSGTIPLETALATLDNFIGISGTKADGGKRIASVSNYYRPANLLTKSSDAEPEDSPDAYLVNFEEGGFAVLGANTSVPDIVTVFEMGCIKDDLTVVLNLPFERLSDYDPSEEDEVLDNFYCEEDDDYYCADPRIDTLVTNLIFNGLTPSEEFAGYGSGNGKNDDTDGIEEENDQNQGHIVDGVYDIGVQVDEIETPREVRDLDDDGRTFLDVPRERGTPKQTHTTREPMLKISWGQTYYKGPGTNGIKINYNSYCKRNKGNEAYAGCSVVAMAMIVATNEFPQSLVLNNRKVDYGLMTDGLPCPKTSQGVEDMNLIIGSIFNNVNKRATKNYTLVTPEQIKRMFEKMGYTNVKKWSDSRFSGTLIAETSSMLARRLPVFISAIPGGISNWEKGHSWVIDGAKYLDDYSDQYLLHFNFGWSQSCNGYFSLRSLNPSEAVEYDNDGIENNLDNYTYSWHFRIITYSKKSTLCEKSFNF